MDVLCYNDTCGPFDVVEIWHGCVIITMVSVGCNYSSML